MIEIRRDRVLSQRECKKSYILSAHGLRYEGDGLVD